MTRFENDLVARLPQMRAFARHLANRDSQLAEDLVQEACVNALRARTQFTPGTNMNAWLFTILRNCFLDTVKRASTRLEQPDDALDRLSRGTVPQLGHLEFMALREAFARLSPEHRDVLLLTVLGQLSYRDMADRCHCEVGTVKSRVSRAREKLREALDDSPDVELRTRRRNQEGHRHDGHNGGRAHEAGEDHGEPSHLFGSAGTEPERASTGCPS
ncbi:MAG: sigma-70 family RNA polymerase sigma factor [Pseudomonadota bacterium]